MKAVHLQPLSTVTHSPNQGTPLRPSVSAPSPPPGQGEHRPRRPLAVARGTAAPRRPPWAAPGPAAPGPPRPPPSPGWLAGAAARRRRYHRALGRGRARRRLLWPRGCGPPRHRVPERQRGGRQTAGGERLRPLRLAGCRPLGGAAPLQRSPESPPAAPAPSTGR